MQYVRIADFIFVWRQIYSCIYITEARVCTTLEEMSVLFICQLRLQHLNVNVKNDKSPSSLLSSFLTRAPPGSQERKEKKGVGGEGGRVGPACESNMSRRQDKKMRILILCATRLHRSANLPLTNHH